MMLAMVFGTAITFSSCGDDDDEPVIKSENSSNDNGESNGNSNTNSALVGAWSPNNGGEVFEFQSNGVFKYYDNYSYSNGTNDEDNWTGTWTYNQASSTVVIKNVVYDQTYTIEIISITSTSVMLKWNGSTMTMSKVNKQGSATTSSLIGYWVGAITSEGETFGASIQINADGTYVETSEEGYNSFSGRWTDNKNGTVTLTGFFDPTFRYTLNGNKLTFTGNGWSGSFTKR